MRHYKITAAAAALTLLAVQAAMTSYAEGTVFTPVYKEFEKTDVNGTVSVEIPENVTAQVEIMFTSPEVTDEPYYIETLDGGASYSFDIEGRDNTYDDYRNYTISVELTGGIYGITSKAYTDTFTVPDGNDNPDSFREISYKFTVDGEETSNEWDVVSDSGNTKEIAFHLDYIKLGDVNSDSLIDADDASAVLSEYSLLSTGSPATFTSRQKFAADINKDSLTDADDATMILSYYSKISTGGTPSWD